MDGFSTRAEGIKKGYRADYTVVAGGSQIVRIRAGTFPTITVKPGSGGTAAVLYTTDDETDLANADWIDSGYGELSANASIQAEHIITGLKLTATTADADFTVLI